MNYDDYKTCRRAGRVPAHLALYWTRRRLDVQERRKRLQFAWTLRDGQYQEARWKQEGFDLRASVIDDPDGWFASGVEVYGRFTERWQPGAVRHWRADARSFKWFIPVDSHHRHESYRRACDYGQGWSYVGVRVVASLHGVALAAERLWGIESDAAADHFTETAFELADQAICAARAQLHALCGCDGRG